MQNIIDIATYLRRFAPELGERIVESFPPLHGSSDPLSSRITALLRRPYPAQSVAIMGVLRRWEQARSAAVVAECGTGKTLIALGSVFLHSRKRFTALAMVPPQLVEKWAREAFRTVPGIRVFFIDGLRQASANSHTGVSEVKLRNGRIVREGLRTSLTDLRLRKSWPSVRARSNSLCSSSALFIIGRDRAKLGYFWKHTYGVARSGRYRGSLVNPDTGIPVYTGEDGERLITTDFKKARLSEWLAADGNNNGKARKSLYSPLWQADRNKIRRFAPIDFIGRHLRGFFDYAIADEVHELKGDTAQGNALGTLAACANRTLILTGTLLGGYADDVFNILFRIEPGRMVAEGFEYGEGGIRSFTERYGLLEKITVVEPADNRCSEARVTKRVRRRPGASPALFGRHLMGLAAFLSLEDISDALPRYEEQVISVKMDAPLAEAYQELEEAVKETLRQHRGNQSALSVGMNALLLYPDRPFGLETLYGYEYDSETKRRERFLIAQPQDLDENFTYAKERRLVEEVKQSLARGRRCQAFAVYTQKRDVTRRLERILAKEGIRVARLTTEVKPELREAWYERQLRQGVEVVLAHPRLVALGLDLLEFPDILFYETGYSLFTLRQASRRSWRIGQRKNVVVKFLHYAETMQETCLRLMGKKLLVSLAMEGKFATEGLQAVDDGDDILMAMARELVTEKAIGESADDVWRQLQKQHEALGISPAQTGETTGPEDLAHPAAEVIESPHVPLLSPPLMFGADASDGRKGSKSGLPGSEAQLSLFGP